MEELLAAVLVCLLAVPILGFLLGSYTRRVYAQPQLAVHKIGDPAVAHRALIDNADDFSDRPVGIFPVSLATWRDGEPNENVTTVSYGRHWSALRCNLTADILHPTRLGSLAPLQQEATRALVARLSGAGAEVADVRECWTWSLHARHDQPSAFRRNADVQQLARLCSNQSGETRRTNKLIHTS
jgi:hypothetical protein